MNTLRLKRIIHGVAVLLIIVGASILIHPGVSSSAPDVVYVYIEGIRGPSQDANHVGWIEASSFSMGLTGGTGGAGGTKPVFGPLKIIKPYDMASPKIALTAALGGHPIPRACVDIDQGWGENTIPNVINVSLKDVLISSVSDTITESTDIVTLMEVVSLTYDRICWQYTPVDPRGNPLPPIATECDLRVKPSEGALAAGVTVAGTCKSVPSCQLCPARF